MTPMMEFHENNFYAIVKSVNNRSKTACILISVLVRTSRVLRDQLPNGCCVWHFIRHVLKMNLRGEQNLCRNCDRKTLQSIEQLFADLEIKLAPEQRSFERELISVDYLEKKIKNYETNCSLSLIVTNDFRNLSLYDFKK